MRTIIPETKRVDGNQTVVALQTGTYLVTSIKNSVFNKTYILKCDSNGKVLDWNEVYMTMPANHKKTLEALNNETLTEKDFNQI